MWKRTGGEVFSAGGTDFAEPGRVQRRVQTGANSAPFVDGILHANTNNYS